MTVTVKVGEAKTHLSELLARVEAGEDIVIACGNDPIAKLTRIQRRSDVEAAIEETRAARARAKPVTQEEVRAWRDEGRH
ncbi:type II toxin-antitoxin system Phd/YefM family antitoxin [Mesorhizobium sp. M0074]|uniref:type II toxin-antitoxin system Phd/YefM family antitoxin n=1 Tax=unclassified Mesorhizobium TaxID=325217 RepID=UPI00333ADCD8